MDCIENSFFIPDSGLSRENLGLSAFMVNSPRVCATVGIIPRAMAIRHIGPTQIPMTVITSVNIVMMVSRLTVVCPMCSYSEPEYARTDFVTSPRSSRIAAKIPSTEAAVTISLLWRTLPSLRWSRRFFGVAFSVFSSPAILPPFQPELCNCRHLPE